MIRLSEAAFACYSKVCAPPPTGRGGSAKAAYWKGKRRGTSSKTTPVTREWPTKQSKRRNAEIDYAQEAKTARSAMIRKYMGG